VTDPLRVLSGKSKSALVWAEHAHRGQEREEDVPYLLHPLAVALLLAASGADRDLLCAGCLHDVLEDTDVTADQLEEKFGPGVLRLVLAVTEDSTERVPVAEQAEHVAARCRAAGVDACALKAADLTVNLTDCVHGAEDIGIEHWVRVFGAERYNEKLDHYEHLAHLLLPEIETDYEGLTRALRARVTELFALRETDPSRPSLRSGWAHRAIEGLRAGENPRVHPRGNSMAPLIRSGEMVELEPVGEGTELSCGDVVLCQVEGNVYLHRISALEDGRVEIADNRGHVNGWTGRDNVFGRRVV